MTTGMALMLAAKGTLLLMLAMLATLLIPRTAAGLRHAVWSLALLMLLLVPAVSLLPGLRVTVPASVLPVGLLPTDRAPLAAATVTEPGIEAAPAPMGARPSTMRSAASLPVLLQVWAAGAVAVLLWLAFGRLALHRIHAGARRLDGDEWNEPLRDAAWLLDARTDVRLYSSDEVRTPVTWGLARPVIVLPADATSWTADRRRAVLLHELAHVVRHDCLTQTMAGVACAAWWIHPLAWYAARRMRVERERACDDMVLAAGTAPAEYAADLLDLARHAGGRAPAPMLSLHMARPTQLEGRLLAVLAGPTGGGRPQRSSLAVAAFAALSVTGMVGPLQPAVAGGTQEVGAPVSPASGDVASSPDVVLPPVPLPDAGPAEPAREAAQASAPAPLPPIAIDTPPARTGTVTVDGQDSIARIVPRVPVRSARYAITSADGRTALLLQDTTIVLQLTDRGLEFVGRGDAAADTDRGFLSALLGSMLRGGLRVLLDRGIEYSLRDLQEARYRDGRLVLQSVRGNDVFENVNIDGKQLMESFSERDAREFARRVNAARARLR